MSQNNPIYIDHLISKEWYMRNESLIPSYPQKIQDAIHRTRALRQAKRDACTALINAEKAAVAADQVFKEAEAAWLNNDLYAASLVYDWEEAVKKLAKRVQEEWGQGQ